MVVTSILRKVIKVIQTTENREQMLSTKNTLTCIINYMELRVNG